LPEQKLVMLRLDRLNRVLGSRLGLEEVTGILQSLGMDATEKDQCWTVQAPSSRFDINIEEDLIEEVARIHGYDELPSSLPAGQLRLGTISERQVAITRMRETMCAAGYHEAINYSFVDKSLLETLKMDEFALPLANPISSDMNVMRTSLLAGLLSSLSRNTRRQQERVRLFETGVVFLQREELEEIDRIGGVICGTAKPEQWGTRSRKLDFYDLKNDVQSLLDLRGGAGGSDFVAAEFDWLHPGQSACVSVADQVIGWAGSVHPGILASLDLKFEVFAFELDITKLSIREIPYTNITSRFPSVRRDIAFLVPDQVIYQQVKECVSNIAGDLLADLLIFDVFSGQNVEKGYKSLAIGLILQDVSCTLTDEVVDTLVLKVIQALETGLNAQLRG